MSTGMSRVRIAAHIIVAFGLLSLVFTWQAYAYIDPGSGSFILQMLMAGFFALLFTLRQFRTKLKNAVLVRLGKRVKREEQ